MILPSSRPYQYQLKVLPEAKAYEFLADNDQTYFITFTAFPFPDPPLRDHGLVLGLELLDPEGRDDGTDPRLEATMIAVVEQILSQTPDSIIVWVCSPDKKQHKGRNILFNRWYRHYKENNGLLNIIKRDVEPSPGEYASLLYRAEHPSREKLEYLVLNKPNKL